MELKVRPPVAISHAYSYLRLRMRSNLRTSSESRPLQLPRADLSFIFERYLYYPHIFVRMYLRYISKRRFRLGIYRRKENFREKISRLFGYLYLRISKITLMFHSSRKKRDSFPSRRKYSNSIFDLSPLNQQVFTERFCSFIQRNFDGKNSSL